MWKKKKSKDRFWTAREVLLIKDWQLKGVPILEQAKRLNRPYSSVRSAITRYNLSGEWYTNYNPEIRSLIMDMLPKGYNTMDVAKRRGMKSHNSTCKIVRELIDAGLLVKLARGKYVATNKWKYVHSSEVDL